MRPENPDENPTLPVNPDDETLSQDTAYQLPRLDDDEPTGDSQKISLLDDPPVAPGTPDPARRLPATTRLTENSDPLPASDTEHKPPESRNREADRARLVSLFSGSNVGPEGGNLETAVLGAKRSLIRRPDTPTDIPLDDQHTTSGQREIILVIRGMVERLVLREKTRIILGRSDIKTRSFPDVDLSPYGASDRGVSREHATLHIEDDRVYVTDLKSTNGTYVDGERLTPYVPCPLAKGKELLLGRLAVQVLFR